MIPFHRMADSFRAAQPKSDTEDHEVNIRPMKSMIAKDRTVSELCIKELKKYTFLSLQLRTYFYGGRNLLSISLFETSE